MSDNFFLQNNARPISAMNAKKAIVFNVGPGTVYYGGNREVSATDYIGTIAAGSSHTFTSNKWIIANEARIFIAYEPELETDMATQAELDAAVLEGGGGNGGGNGGGGGSGVLSGNGVPDPDLGEIGDLYLQLDSDPPTLYGPKTEAGWGDPVTIGGGAMLSGEGPPSGGLGTDGDFYVDTLTNLLYGPKTGGVWGDPIDLGASTTGGAAGGVLSGIYPNPGFAVDMATQAELDAAVSGVAGAPLISAPAAPEPTDGAVGDYFLDTAAGALYGPKDAITGWGDPILLAGLPVLTGVGSPTSDLGGDGDWYLSPSNSLIFGPKADGEWPEGVSYMGVAGKGFMAHGASGSAARPTGYESVEWVGTVEPLNAIDGDTWINP